MKGEDLPLISVIISLYNSRKTIKDCLNSVKEQTYAHLEIILVDDGSEDRVDGLYGSLVLQNEVHYITLSESREN